jgi:hypothetical protein
MNTSLHPIGWRVRAAQAAIVGLAAGGMTLAAADTPIPDPPIPAEARIVLASADMPSGADYPCGALGLHDLGSQIDRHVAQWQAMHRSAHAKPGHRMHTGNLVEGVVGFPVRHYRLAADEDDAAKR